MHLQMNAWLCTEFCRCMLGIILNSVIYGPFQFTNRFHEDVQPVPEWFLTPARITEFMFQMPEKGVDQVA